MRYRYQSAGTVYNIKLERNREGYHVTIDGIPYDLQVLEIQPGQLSLMFEGKPVSLFWADVNGKKHISLRGCTYVLEKPAPTRGKKGEEDAENIVRSPMPAQVRAVYVAEGEQVSKGDRLLLLEAMKMEILIQAPQNGVVSSVQTDVGQSVNRDQVLVEITIKTQAESE
jgi:3-methylcrotonyl-CoA carboxylase alpha subunit